MYRERPADNVNAIDVCLARLRQAPVDRCP